MLLFGHAGVTTGIVKVSDILAARVKYGDAGRISGLDYRLVFLGSLLPDIIDKPVWLLVGNSASLSGRDYAHTLLFQLALLIGAAVMIRFGKPWLLILSVASLLHLVFDQMWRSPAALFWPLLGPLPKEERTGWIPEILQALFSQPEVYIPEIIGLIIVLLLAGRVASKKNVLSFIKTGVVK